MFNLLNLFKKKPVQEPQFYIMNCVKACPKNEKKCPLWTVMYRTMETDGKKRTDAEGHCAIAWIPTLLVEINETIAKGINNGKK